MKFSGLKRVTYLILKYIVYIIFNAALITTFCKYLRIMSFQ